MNRTRRSAFAALVTLAAVLFSQIAVAAYACQGTDAMRGAAVSRAEVPPCHEQQPQDGPSALCNAHCQQGDQSVAERGTSVSAGAFVALPSLVSVTRVDLRQVAPGRQALDPLLERPTGPPLAVRHCRFNI